MNQVVIKLLPDGSGRVRIHWFCRDDKGPIRTAEAVTMSALGPVRLGGATGRIACQPQRKSVAPEVNGLVTTPCVHSDDARAVTCPECMKTPEYAAAMKAYSEIMETPLTEAQLRSVAGGVAWQRDS